MAPWDELPYFDLPIVTNFAGPATKVVAQSNSNRVGLIFSSSTAVAGLQIAPKGPVSNGTGISVNQGFPLLLNSRDNPGLVQAEWFANIPNGTNLCVVEMTMNEWPRGIEVDNAE